MGAFMREHRGVEYEIIKVETQWRSTIYRKEEFAPKPRTPLSYSTQREADTACRADIDRSVNAHRT